MRRYDICGIGNAIVDILLNVSEEEFGALKLDRGTMRLVSLEEQRDLLARFGGRKLHLVSGGSVANSVIASAQLGCHTALICCLGDDEYGGFYKSECFSLGVTIENPLALGQATGTCVALITPDAERTMRTCLAVSANLSERQVDEDLIASSDWLLIEGYLFANPTGPAAIDAAVAAALRHHTKIALTVSEEFIVKSFRPALDRVLPHCSLVFSNESEACALSGASGYDAAFGVLKERFAGVVVTAGPKGALVSFGGQEKRVDAYPCKPLDLTGAGDMFAGIFLSCVSRGMSAVDATRAGCYLAMKVISRYGARLPNGHVQALHDVTGKRLPSRTPAVPASGG